MGLDWKPINKPKSGTENEYEELFMILGGRKKQKLTLIEKLQGKKKVSESELQDRFFNISTTPYETLNAPRVGIASVATEWANEAYQNRPDKSQSLSQYLDSMYGYYVVDLVELHDGIPTYIALHDEPHVFRAQFLNDCEKVIGPELFDEAYSSKLAKEAVDYGNRLMNSADEYALLNNLTDLKNVRVPPDVEELSSESIVHILYSAAKWTKWWGERGHGYEAYF
jgi:hypothetical protein